MIKTVGLDLQDIRSKVNKYGHPYYMVNYDLYSLYRDLTQSRSGYGILQRKPKLEPLPNELCCLYCVALNDYEECHKRETRYTKDFEMSTLGLQSDGIYPPSGVCTRQQLD